MAPRAERILTQQRHEARYPRQLGAVLAPGAHRRALYIRIRHEPLRATILGTLKCQELISRRLKPVLVRCAIVACGALAACAGQGPSQPDARVADDANTAGPDAEIPCTADLSNTYYADFDGDGYGSPDLIAVDCTRPDRFVDNSLDCDDADSRNNPDGIELCDGLDNDCNAETVENCLSFCSPQVRDSDVYLFCAQPRIFSAAKSACEAEAMHLVRIDDQVEQSWISDQRIIAFGNRPNVWMGGSDAAIADTWVWHDGEPFWQGRANGAALGELFALWGGGEPNNDNGSEACGIVGNNAIGYWDDRPCNHIYRFVCERDAEVL